MTKNTTEGTKNISKVYIQNTYRKTPKRTMFPISLLPPPLGGSVVMGFMTHLSNLVLALDTNCYHPGRYLRKQDGDRQFLLL